MTRHWSCRSPSLNAVFSSTVGTVRAVARHARRWRPPLAAAAFYWRWLRPVEPSSAPPWRSAAGLPAARHASVIARHARSSAPARRLRCRPSLSAAGAARRRRAPPSLAAPYVGLVDRHGDAAAFARRRACAADLRTPSAKVAKAAAGRELRPGPTWRDEEGGVLGPPAPAAGLFASSTADHVHASRPRNASDGDHGRPPSAGSGATAPATHPQAGSVEPESVARHADRSRRRSVVRELERDQRPAIKLDSAGHELLGLCGGRGRGREPALDAAALPPEARPRRRLAWPDDDRPVSDSCCIGRSPPPRSRPAGVALRIPALRPDAPAVRGEAAALAARLTASRRRPSVLGRSMPPRSKL